MLGAWAPPRSGAEAGAIAGPFDDELVGTISKGVEG